MTPIHRLGARTTFIVLAAALPTLLLAQPVSTPPARDPKAL
jgi:hypothetical protein